MFATRRWVFVHIPRTGGTNVRLNAVNLPNTEVLFDSPLGKHNPLWTVNFSEFRPSYTIVRNPYERYASLWKQLSVIGSIDCTFEAFVKDVSYDEHTVFKDLGWDRDKYQWRLNLPQAGFIGSHTSWVKLEDRQSLERLEVWIGVKFLHSQHHANPETDYKSLYTDQLKDIVYKRFEIDFDRFGYTKQWK